MINPRRAGLVSVLCLSLVLLVAAAPATARDFTLKGRSDATTACNADALFRLTVSLAKGKFIEVKSFRTYGIAYPNRVPAGTAGLPIPVGLPTGNCVPGDAGWQTHEWQCPGGTEQSCTAIPALADPSYVNEFHGFLCEANAGWALRRVPDHRSQRRHRDAARKAVQEDAQAQDQG
jgi:hypothetical protein